MTALEIWCQALGSVDCWSHFSKLPFSFSAIASHCYSFFPIFTKPFDHLSSISSCFSPSVFFSISGILYDAALFAQPNTFYLFYLLTTLQQRNRTGYNLPSNTQHYRPQQQQQLATLSYSNSKPALSSPQSSNFLWKITFILISLIFMHFLYHNFSLPAQQNKNRQVICVPQSPVRFTFAGAIETAYCSEQPVFTIVSSHTIPYTRLTIAYIQIFPRRQLRCLLAYNKNTCFAEG